MTWAQLTSIFALLLKMPVCRICRSFGGCGKGSLRAGCLLWAALMGSGGGQEHPGDRAFSGIARDLDLTVMLACNGPGNRQPKTGTADSSETILGAAIKALENVRQVFGRDSNSVVHNINEDNRTLISPACSQQYFHFAARFRILDGIVEQDEKKPAQSALISGYRALSRCIARQTNVGGLRQHARIRRDSLSQFR